jgi:hypothetical protein
MSNCFHAAKALTLYDPEEHREVVHFYRNRQDAPDEKGAERITHQRLAELLCMDGRGYDLALERFEKLCKGERIQLMTQYEYWLDPTDVEVVARNNVAALAEWEALQERAKEKGEFGNAKHEEGDSWKNIALSIRALTASPKMNEEYQRDEITKAHLAALANKFKKSSKLKLAA